jgi:drug/metabolite transporter (DMT)-like permease
MPSFRFAAAADRANQGGRKESDKRLPQGNTDRRSLLDRPYLLLSLASLFWAINIVLGRYIVGTVPPIMLAQIRWTGAGLILLPFVLHHLRRDWPAIRAHLGVMIALSLSGITLYNTLAYYALQYTQAINGLLIQSTGPLIIGLISYLFFRDRLTAGQIAGILLSLVGVLTIITRGEPAAILGLDFNLGDLLFLLALVIYSAYLAAMRRRPPIHMLSFLAFTILAGAALQIPATVVEYAFGHRIDPTPQAFAVMIYVAIFPSLIAYLFFNRGVDLIGANRAGPFLHLIPVFGSVIAFFFLGERPGVHHLVGYALILGGIFAAQRFARK